MFDIPTFLSHAVYVVYLFWRKIERHKKRRNVTKREPCQNTALLTKTARFYVLSYVWLGQTTKDFGYWPYFRSTFGIRLGRALRHILTCLYVYAA